MFSRSLLLVLLLLACLQSFTMSEGECDPGRCCFSYIRHRIPVRVITDYKETDHRCSKPGVMFILKDGHPVCADPSVDWVKSHMKKIDQHLITSLIQP